MEAISYTLYELEPKDNDIQNLLQEFEQELIDDEDDIILSQITFYDNNFNNKQLLLICEYYGINKQARTMKKQEIISIILLFERNEANAEIVLKRKILWGYMEDLKNDKVMKRFVIW